jgi:LytS/YehU family sensor histidine kinase
MNLEGVRILAVAISVALACAVWAVWRRRRGAWPVAIGVGASCVLLLIEAQDYRASFFLKFLPTLVGLIASVAWQVRDERRQVREAQLASARLELELLKKNLQPHFLLNTLATIIEVIEQEPKTAVALIESLAREFRILARVAGEKLIPLAHELELCRAHLRIMSLRKGARCSLTVTEADEHALVPPALFHTLVENGLTHLLPSGGEQRFELSAARDAGSVRYTLVAHGEPVEHNRAPTLPPLAGTPVSSSASPVARREGTGLRYVKARLEESFPGRWTLHGGAIPEGWRTVIEIAGPGREASA